MINHDHTVQARRNCLWGSDMARLVGWQPDAVVTFSIMIGMTVERNSKPRSNNGKTEVERMMAMFSIRITSFVANQCHRHLSITSMVDAADHVFVWLSQ